MTPTKIRRSVKFLIAVWGVDYIARLDRFGFASLMAPGNLPALARDHEVEFVLLTTSSSIASFENTSLIESLREHASIRYVAIDDLITRGHFTTTLHLAFTRGVTLFGEEMVNTSFIFWNADFVLANGSLAHLSKLIQQDHRVIITGTLRASAEEAEPLMEAMRDKDTGLLTAAPRELVDVCFRFGHPHHAAKTVNQTASWSLMPSQMLWRVNPTTLLGRFFQSFMFCLRPTRVITAINGPCDYAFVPELCPGEPQYLIDDSDDAFILELQPRAAESEFIRLGPRNEDARRACMMEWLTAEHLDTGRRVVTIRSGDAPPPQVLSRATAEFEAYFNSFMKAAPPPLPHQGQYYWLYGVADWVMRRPKRRRTAALPAELETTLTLEDLKHGSNDRHRALLTARPRRRPSLRAFLFGQPHFPAWLHPDAASTRTLKKVAADAVNHAGELGTILTVAPLFTVFDILLPASRPQTYLFEPLPARVFSLAGPATVKSVVVYFNSPHQLVEPCGLFDRIAPALADGALVQMVWHNPGLRSALSWIETCAMDAGPLTDRLENFELNLLYATRRDQRYARRLYSAMPHFVDAAQRPRGLTGKIIAGFATLLRAAGLGSRKLTGMPRVIIARGRYRRNVAKVAAPVVMRETVILDSQAS